MTSNTPHTSPIVTALACTLGATLIAGCSGLPWQAANPVQQLTPAVGASLQNCDALPQQFNFARAQIDSSARVAAGAMKQGDHPLPVCPNSGMAAFITKATADSTARCNPPWAHSVVDPSRAR